MDLEAAFAAFREAWLAVSPARDELLFETLYEEAIKSSSARRALLDNRMPGWDDPVFFDDIIPEEVNPLYDLEGVPEALSPPHTRSGARYGRQFLEESFDEGYETAMEAFSDAEISSIEEALVLEPLEEAGGAALALWIIPIAMAAIGLYIDYRVGKYFYEKIKSMSAEDFEEDDEEGKLMLRLMQNFSSTMVQHNYIGKRAQRLGPLTMVPNWRILGQ